MANQLVESLSRDFDPKRYEDTHRDAVLDLLKRKSKGEEIDLLEQEEPEQGDDLAAALEASLRHTNGRSADGGRSKRKSSRRGSGSRRHSKARART